MSQAFTEVRNLRQIATDLGQTVTGLDTYATILKKILVGLGGTPEAMDTPPITWRKILAAKGGEIHLNEHEWKTIYRLNEIVGAERSVGFTRAKLVQGLVGKLTGDSGPTVPDAPVIQPASDILGKSFSANWLASATATGYKLYVSTAADFSSHVAGYDGLDVGNVITYSVTGLAYSTLYYFRVIAYNAVGDSAHSDSANTTTTEAPKFIFTVNTTIAGSTPSDSFRLYAGSEAGYVYDAEIDWGDGSTSEITSYTDPDLLHVYAAGGVKTISISGSFPWLRSQGLSEGKKWLTIEQWGDIGREKCLEAFDGCEDLVLNATDTLVLPPNCSKMFFDCYRMVGNINNFDTSAVTDMSNMFADCQNLNSPVDQWDTSNVTNMVALFRFCQLFNQSVANFDTSKVTNMWLMLNTYGSFNQSLANFDLSGLDSTGSLDAICANTVIDTANYDATLISWAAQLPLAYAFSPHFASAKYSPAAASARADLVSAGWTITDGGPV